MLYLPLVDFKACSQCGREFPATLKNFYKSGNRLYGQCKSCHNANCRSWQGDNRDKVRSATRKYDRAHPEEKRIRDNAHRLRTIDKHRKQTSVATHRGKARQKGVACDFTVQDWDHCLDYWGHRCAICGRTADSFYALAQDHWIPLSKMGSYTPDNILPLCQAKHLGKGGCNELKNNSDPKEWVLKTLGESAGQEKLAEINAYFSSLKVEA